MSAWQNQKPLTHEEPHVRPDDLNPKVNGPFLDDIREEQERAYREARNSKAAKKDPKPLVKDSELELEVRENVEEAVGDLDPSHKNDEHKSETTKKVAKKNESNNK